MFRGNSVWVLEDDQGSQFVYEEILAIRYNIKIFNTVKDFRAALTKKNIPELIIADIRLPDESFTQFLSNDSDRVLLKEIPLIVVSSVDDLDVLRSCFKFGAKDYITKPFGRNELAVKIERFLDAKSQNIAAGLCNLDSQTLTVLCDGHKSPPLTSKEFQIVSVLHRASEYEVTKKQILNIVWGGVKVTAKAFDVHLFNIRRKLSNLHMEIIHLQPNTYKLIKKEKSKQYSVSF